MRGKITTKLHTDYGSEISSLLRPAKSSKYTALDLFAGAGGLSLGLEAVGFQVTGIEQDEDCCNTYDSNLRGKCLRRVITPHSGLPDADIVVGGPPCQPFSVHGKQRGMQDNRNGMPSFIQAVKRIRPQMWMLENVRGMLYRNKDYFTSSMKKLEKLGYQVDMSVENCSDYGVPQNRERIIAVGHHGEYSRPDTPRVKVTAGEALKDIPRKHREKPRYLTPAMDRYIAVYEAASHCRPRDLIMNRPARTLTCRNLGGYSSDMHRIRTRNGKRRVLYVREAARLQGFPDWFEFSGSRYDIMSQIGNAVPPIFARILGARLMECISKI